MVTLTLICAYHCYLGYLSYKYFKLPLLPFYQGNEWSFAFYGYANAPDFYILWCCLYYKVITSSAENEPANNVGPREAGGMVTVRMRIPTVPFTQRIVSGTALHSIRRF